jgi:hypothetical protein
MHPASGGPLPDGIRPVSSRLFHFLPPVCIKIPSERKDEVDALMRRHLSTWPEQLYGA